MSRDSQRRLVYDAEHELRFILDNGGTIALHGSTLTVPAERKFGDVAAARRYIEAVLSLPSVAAMAGADVPVTVRERAGAAKAHYEYDTATIALPPHRPGRGNERAWALREVVVLHELAHHLTRDGAPHGGEFAATFVHLLDVVVGPEAGHLLRVALWERGAVIDPVTSRGLESLREAAAHL